MTAYIKDDNLNSLASHKQLLLAEMPYQSIQGEGMFFGTPMIFLRLQGCDVGCVWCDSYYTWFPFNRHKIPLPMIDKLNYIYVNYEDVNMYLQSAGNSKHIWITGGEPLLQALGLVKFLKQASKSKLYHICTAGTIFNKELAELLDFITVDVKAPASGTKSNIDVLNKYESGYAYKLEYKMVIASTDIDRKFAIEFAKAHKDIQLTLQPMYSSELGYATGNSVDTVMGDGLANFASWFNRTFDTFDNVSLGVQLHKHLYPNKKRGI